MATTARPVFYETPGGWKVYDLSHSSYSMYRESPAKFRWRYLHGLKERLPWATSEHGKDVQDAIIAFYRDKDPVATFKALWAPRAKQELHWPESTDWEKLNRAGIGLMENLVARAKEFPLENPVFLSWKDKSLPHLQDAATGVGYVSIPDVIEPGKFIADMKVLPRRLPEDNPNLVVLDSQLRTQAAVSKIYRVALWVFPKSPRHLKPTAKRVQEIISGNEDAVKIEATRAVLGTTIDETGKLLGIAGAKELSKDFKKRAKKDTSLAEISEKLSAAISAECRDEYQIQWLEGEMTPEHAMAQIREELSIIPFIQQGFFPCRCSLRWPNDGALRCPYAGLCLEAATPNAKPEWIEQWRKMTAENLKRWDESALDGLDEE